LVVVEVSAGDAQVAQLRLNALKDIPWVSSTKQVEWIASELEQRGLVPPNAAADAFHIAYPSAHGIDYLLTWNCRHIANAERLPAIAAFLSGEGLAVPIVCTPEELMGDVDKS
jgi:hypothetical protein